MIFNEISTGAQDDIQKATDIAKRMVMEYGMSDCGQRSFSTERATFIQSPNGSLSAAREYSESVAEQIDREISTILSSAYQRVKTLLSSKK